MIEKKWISKILDEKTLKKICEHLDCVKKACERRTKRIRNESKRVWKIGKFEGKKHG